ncbi:ABC transporter permease [Bradyrhizobium sp. WD16]|uniref:ABC transporter permease n=1 Tax=Bradyrhizobium sp. WD16 TaxID=1521768 RepID=UPI0020A3E2ED|nr:ABC transporter permease [Bradyrhizobium sp. WD16]UTD27940.1 spermidine/putrescine ABC transporter permease [Bradyrhizobium sp. WD16]
MSQAGLRRLFFALMAVVMAAPLIVVIGVSLNEKKSLTFPPQGISFSWYFDIFRDPDWFNALSNSVMIALASALLALAIAFPLAWYVWRYRSRWAKMIVALGLIPFLLPPVITALGLLAFWIETGAYGQPWTIVLSHAILLVSLPLFSLTLGFSRLDPSLSEAAATMGADERTVTMTVILPLIRPYAISSFAFTFVASLNEYIVAFMTVGPVLETLPMKIFNALRYGYTPVMAAASVFFVVVTVTQLALIARFGDLPKLLGADRK